MKNTSFVNSSGNRNFKIVNRKPLARRSQSKIVSLILLLFFSSLAWGQTTTVDFETNDFSQIPGSYTNSDSYPWTVATGNAAYAGSYGMKSGGAGTSSMTSDFTVEMDYSFAGTISFRYKISSESGYDKGYFLVDGSTKLNGVSGSGSWTQVSYDVTAGNHTFIWRYSKDGSVNSNEDCFYIDDIVFDIPYCVTLTSPVNGAEINTASPTLVWDAVGDATSYHIYLSNTTDKPAQYSYNTSSSSVTVSDVPYGVTYCWVVPCDGNGELNTCGEYTYFKRTCPATIASPTITANTDLSHLVCGQIVTLTASGDYANFRWYSDAGCSSQVGEGQTYSFAASDQPITIYCKAVCVGSPAMVNTQPFYYTGAVQTYSVPSGVQSLKLEVWGAQGGTYSSYTGGLGGYSVGTLNNLSGVTSLNVYVGGAGTTSTAAGYNGGGAGVSSGRGGGGATDIRLGGSTLYDRIIVAGGGGGAGVSYGNVYPAGCGGGEYGGDGYYNYTNGTYVTGNYRSGGGATQTQGGISWNSISSTQGTFGQGGNANNYSCGGGGGGWYGGGGAYDNDSDSDGRYGGGGSGYVWTSATASSAPSGYNVSSSYYLTDAQTIAGNTTFPAPNGGNETGHEGNGFARISYTTPEDISLSSASSATASAASTPATPVVEVAGACPGEDVVLTVTNVVDGLTYGWWDNSSCTGTPLYEGTSYTINNMQSNATYYVRAYTGTLNPVYEFDYTGDVQTLTVPGGATSATLEVWGAEGGASSYHGTSGGKGGYSVGTVTLTPNQTLYVYVGGAGTTGSYNVSGGWNGGGGITNEYNSGGDGNHIGTGGGATDISTVGGNCTLDARNRYVRTVASYNARIIVAGGGGGAEAVAGTAGGGESGGGAYAGTQSQAGQAYINDAGDWVTLYDAGLGYGVSTSGGHTNHAMGSCGGGGYYGGGCYANNGSGAYGAGGSGYIGGVTVGYTHDGTQTFPAPDGSSETGHSGNGYARITFNDATPSCLSAIGTVQVQLGTAPSFTLNPLSATSCNQTPVTFTITNAAGNILYYDWSDGTTNTTETTHVVTPGSTTTYTVTAYNAYCSASQSSTVSVDAPEVTIVGSDNGDCVDAGTEVTLNAGECPDAVNQSNGITVINPGCEVDFYDDGGPSGNYSSNQNLTHTFTSSDGSPISIVFTSMSAEECCDYIYVRDGTASSYIELYNGYMYQIATNTTYIANSGNLTIYSTSDGSVTNSGWVAKVSCGTPRSFTWSNGLSERTITVTPTESTTYTLTVTADGYACPTIKEYTVHVNPTPEISPMNPMVCAGRTITLTASGADEYHWNNDATTATITVGAGTYTVTATNADGCSAEVASTVTSLTTPSAGEIADMEVCESDYEITLVSNIAATGGGNVEYSWTIGSVTTAWSENATYTLTASDRATLGTGTFSVARNFRDGCDNTGSATATLTINPHMDAPTISGLTNIYRGLSATLTAVPAYNSEHFTYHWYSDPQGQSLVYEGKDFTTPSLETETTYYLQIKDEHIEEGSPSTYSTSGSYTYNVPDNAEYVKLEVWGAQGGTYSSYTGGLGGYSVGTLNNLSGVTSLNVFVGGAGTTSTAAGYNGGGTGVSSGRGGGGATDIRLGGSSLYDRIIVAGGGGGAGVTSANVNPAGCGGGEYGGDGYYNYTNGTYVTGSNRCGGGATQTQGGISWNSMSSTQGTFGQGGNAYSYSCGGGGGGWYGGGGAYDNDSDSDGRWGGGGSGYVWTATTASSAPSGYNVSSSYYLADAQTIAGNTEFPAPNGGMETGHTGDGYARITPYYYIQDNCPSELIPVTIEITEPPAPIVQVNSACIGTPSELEVVNPIDGVVYQWSTTADFSSIEATGLTFTPIVNAQTNYYVRSVVGNGEEVIDFDYTGSEQSYTIPAGVSKVQLEVWGAQGGNASVEGSYMGAGGAGGYSKGLYSVSEGNTLYVVVGGQGTSSTSITSSGTLQGGYNGGGNSMGGDTYCAVAAGGGATHISTTSGVLSSLSPSSVIIVAGGGGGAGTSSNSSYTQYGTGGYGGGVSGGTGISGYASYSPGGGGTQSQGGSKCPSSDYSYEGSFGQGGNQTGNSGGWGAGAGGGGYYGGGSGGALGATGGGGSGYIGGVTSGVTYDGSETFLAVDGTNETGHTGNGYARITLLDLATDYCASPTTTVTINPVEPPTFTLTSSAYSNCNGDPVELTAQNPSSDIISYHWSDGATTTEPTCTVTPGHTTSYAVTATNGTCEMASMPIVITVDAPSLLITGSDNGECIVSGTEVTLNAIADMPFPTMASQYHFSVGNRTFEPLTSSSTSITTGDDAYTTVAIGFTFTYCDRDYTEVKVSTNGYVRFIDPNVSGSDAYSNNLTSTTTNPIIAAYWDDIDGDVMYVQTLGEAPNRVFVFHTVGNRYANSNYTYQIRLYETTNIIEIHYGSTFDMTSSSSASIGLNSNNGGLSFLSVTPTGNGTATTSTATADNNIGTTQAAYLTAGTLYTFSPFPQFNYQWASNGTTIQGAETNNLSVSPLESVIYTATVTDGEHGCPAIWDYTVKVLPTPSLTTDESPICLGAEATLTAGGAGTNGTYNWGEGYVSGNTNVVLPTNNTTYRVTVKNVNGCTASSYVDQEVQMAPGNTPMTHVVQGHIWTGRVNSDWNVPRNWVVFTGGGSGYTIAENAPTASDQVVIRSGSTCIDNQPSVSTNSTASNVIIRDGRTLTVEGSRTLAVNGDIDIESGGALAFSGSGMVSVTGDANIASGASVTFGNKDTLNVAGTFTLRGNLDFPASDTTPALRLGGNLVIDGGSLDEGGTLVFAGNGPQSINNGGTAPTINNNVRLNMHHSRAGVPHTIFPDGTIFSKTTIFEYGIMDGNVTFNETGRAIVCGDYESYASGRISKIGAGNNFTFPTGDDNVLGSVTARIGAGNTVYAKFHHKSSDNGDGTHGFGLDVIPRWWNVADMCGGDPFNHVTNFEYWDISSPVELSDVMLMANAATGAEHFSDGSAYVDADIQVAAYKDNCWNNFGGRAEISGADHNVITIREANIPKDPHRAVADFLITLGSKSNATVLPIELLSFSATCNGKYVELDWSTASERNNDYFVIERSDDAIEFTEVGRVAGAGNSIEQLDYTYNDYGIHGGDNYYRLVQVDYDGTRSVSDIVVATCIDTEVGEPDVQAYPNPFNDELTIVLDNFDNRPATIEVYDMLGKLICNQKADAPQNSYETILNLSNLPPAAYTVRVSTADFVINKSVVKN